MQNPEEIKRSIKVMGTLFPHYAFFPDYENVLKRSYESFLQPGCIILDVGANQGLHLEHFLRIAGPAGKVIAFEPLPDLRAALITKFQQEHPWLVVHQVALGKAVDRNAVFVRAEGSLPESGLRERQYNDPAAVSPVHISVVVEKIDNIIAAENLSKIDYIKMDIEGGELDALEGGINTIGKYRPIISVEWGIQAYSAYGHQEDSLFQLTERLGYVIHDPFLQNIGSRAMWDFAKSRYYCWDYFLIPAERAAEMKSLFD